MGVSDRSSDRVADEIANDLHSGRAQMISGADGGGSAVSPPPVGARQLARLSQDLTTVERDVLGSLRDLHYLTTTQIERLHFRRADRSNLAAARASRRSLVRLYESGLVSRLERRVGGVRGGSSSHVYRLGPAGHRLLDAPSRRRSREPSLLHLDHVLEVAELVVRLQECRREGRIEGLAVEGEPGCWRSYVGLHGAMSILKPDLRLTVVGADQELHWFVELDRASEHGPILQRKMRAYVEAWRAGVEGSSGVFPRVLWVVPDEARARLLRSALEGLTEVPEGMAEVCTNDAAVATLIGGQL